MSKSVIEPVSSGAENSASRIKSKRGVTRIAADVRSFIGCPCNRQCLIDACRATYSMCASSLLENVKNFDLQFVGLTADTSSFVANG